MGEITPGLVLVHGNRVEQLRDLLLAWTRSHQLGVLENECILVQSNGIAQWLRLALAERDTGCGIAAGLEFLLPARFMWQAYRSVLGPAAVPEQSPLDKDALVWRLMRLLPGLMGQTEFAGLSRFLADDANARKRHQLAWQLADLYDQYQVYRPDWLQAWAQGQEIILDGRGNQHPVPELHVWQVRLWQSLQADIGSCAHLAGRAAIHAAFMEKIQSAADTQRPAGLPRRLLVFGISAMPRQILEALAGLARWMQIMVFIHNPCAHYWADIQGDQELLRARFRRQARRPGLPEHPDADTLYRNTHPLLASWGRQGRDFISQLDDIDDPDQRQRWGQEFAALHKRIDAFENLPGASLLEQLQDDILELRPPHETRQQWPAVDVQQDQSIRFHVAHSAQREVEILHDQLLDAFAADPSLQPRDIIVMVPEIESYAPHIQAVFGLYGSQDKRYIPYALADRGQRRADPLVIVLEQLLNLPRMRLGVQQVMEFLDVPSFRARFDIRSEDLPLLRIWVRESCIRWGLDADHKSSFVLDLDQASAHGHTWLFGLRRMLLGYASGAGRDHWHGIEPYDQVSGLQAGLLGSLARLLDTLAEYWELLRVDATPAVWVERLQAIADAFFLPDDSHDADTLMRFRETLQDWLDLCVQAGLDEPLPCSLVAEHCLSQLDQARLSQQFFAGAVTFATLMPMRAIPFRRVCLLGMQDGAFPRQRVTADFDLIGSYPRPGDRSRREDDRYMFLEALLSARDQLYVSWVGRSIVDNTEKPPSVLLAQLQSHIDASWSSADGSGPLSGALSTIHPLQPFSVRYFPDPNSQDGSPLFTYAAQWRDARASLPDSQVSRPLPVAAIRSAVSLKELQQFLRHPVRAFFQQSLQVFFDAIDLDLDEHEPYAPDGLQIWQLNDEILSAMPELFQVSQPDAGWDDKLEQILARMQRRGTLAAGSLGHAVAQDLRSSVSPAIAAYAQACEHWPYAESESLHMRSQPLAEVESLVFKDALAGWRRNEDGQYVRIIMQAGRLVGQSRNQYRLSAMLASWIEHVAAHVHGRSHETVVVSPKGCVIFPHLEDPQRIWQSFWHAWLQGRSQTLPVELNAASAWLRSGADTKPDGNAWFRAAESYTQSLEHDLYLRRSYPDFAALCENQEFFHWAQLLYGDLADSIKSWEPKSVDQEAV